MVDLQILAAELIERLSHVKYALPHLHEDERQEQMLDKLRDNVEQWPIHKTFMRIGFLQGRLEANGCPISEIKAMIAEAYAAHDAYCDVLDHNDSTSEFSLDVGGEG